MCDAYDGGGGFLPLQQPLSDNRNITNETLRYYSSTLLFLTFFSTKLDSYSSNHDNHDTHGKDDEDDSYKKLSRKRSAPPSDRPTKRLRRELSVAEKLWVCAERQAGASKGHLAAKYNLDPMSVTLILSNAVEFAQMHANRNINIATRKRATGGGRKAAWAREEQVVSDKIIALRAEKKTCHHSTGKRGEDYFR